MLSTLLTINSRRFLASSQGMRLCLRRTFADLPSHTVVGLPALSPTMTHGNLAKWHKKDGDEIAAGDVICEVETDKATVDFEAQDEGVVAKVFVKEGTSDIAVGSPIMVLVESKDDVAAFADFVANAAPAPAPKEAEAEASAAAAPSPAPAPAPAAPKPPKAAAPAVPPPPPEPSPAPAPAPVAASPSPPPSSPAPVSGEGKTTYTFQRWGTLARGGALAKRMKTQQQAYIEKYGSTGQTAI